MAYLQNPVLRPRERDRVERAALGRKPDILTGVRLGFGIFERSANHLRGPFAEHRPRARAVNRFAVHAQPPADIQQNSLRLLWNRAVGSRPDIQQQSAVLAGDIHQLVHDRIGGLEFVVLDVAPGFFADGSIGLPEEGPL